jgi:hypothetical protein
MEKWMRRGFWIGLVALTVLTAPLFLSGPGNYPFWVRALTIIVAGLAGSILGLVIGALANLVYQMCGNLPFVADTILETATTLPWGQRRHKVRVVGSCLFFALGVAALAPFTAGVKHRPPIATAVEIMLYGVLWVAAISTFVNRLHDLRRRLMPPVVIAGVVVCGCVAYALLSHNEESWHVFATGIVLGLLIVAKGAIGMLGAATSLSMAAYGILHGINYHIPLFSTLVEFILGEVNLALEYVCAFAGAAFSLGTVLAADPDATVNW